MNLANFLTALRILLTPVSVLFLFWEVPHQDLLAAGLFVLAGLTDGLDGWAARVRKQTTQFGKSFDPFADKVLITTALVCLAKLGRVPWWMVWAIIGREVTITILRQIAGRRGAQVAASPWGKAKTLTQIVAVTAVILWPTWAIFLLWPALILTLGSGVDYLFRWRHAFRRQTKSIPPTAA
ncbi:MAG: CDP-diacylglycerol--glycerol-3-phosphate 3-phosphatidyltransferase [Firmicutes bacterium]|nr:CDP-diacylglycerol--glycerol-3-phosphate 3-phosphatidyltransferase [Bacillota bacterium]